jgi:hypothetical protein
MLRVSADHAGSVQDSSPAAGTFVLPYIAEENVDEDPELRATVTGDSPAAQHLREQFLTRGRQVRMALSRCECILLQVIRQTCDCALSLSLCLSLSAPCVQRYSTLHPLHMLHCL